jgi:hypothetical protein
MPGFKKHRERRHEESHQGDECACIAGGNAGNGMEPAKPVEIVVAAGAALPIRWRA